LRLCVILMPASGALVSEFHGGLGPDFYRVGVGLDFGEKHASDQVVSPVAIVQMKRGPSQTERYSAGRRRSQVGICTL
jgi:hypothetical protein